MKIKIKYNPAINNNLNKIENKENITKKGHKYPNRGGAVQWRRSKKGDFHGDDLQSHLCEWILTTTFLFDSNDHQCSC